MIYLQQIKIVMGEILSRRRPKSLLVIGNGPSSRQLNLHSVIELLENRQLDIIVVNSFFAQTDIELPDIRGIMYFYLDTHLLPVINKPESEINEYILAKIEYMEDEELAQTYKTYIHNSAFSDVKSLKIALNRKNTCVFVHPKYCKILPSSVKPINILPYQKLVNLFGGFVSRLFKFHSFTRYFGSNVMNSAIMYGVNNRYQNVYVIGHGGRFQYEVNETWSINYPYFYGPSEKWFNRKDCLRDFGRNYLVDRVKQYYFPQDIKSRVKFLGHDHDNFALLASSDENRTFLNG